MAFRNTVRYATDKQLFIAPEGMYSGQYIYCGKKATLNIGNVKPVGSCREGEATGLPGRALQSLIAVQMRARGGVYPCWPCAQPRQLQPGWMSLGPSARRAVSWGSWLKLVVLGRGPHALAWSTAATRRSIMRAAAGQLSRAARSLGGPRSNVGRHAF